jgi:nitroimidazol reductase NimA-like FMN-containing flavoprotein (pyridoxamine 5'-phosphate oxidase superfamily)
MEGGTMYHMVKKKLEIIDSKVIDGILSRGKFLTLSLCRDNEPYIVTLSYGFDENRNVIFFHCAKRGLKLDFIRVNPEVCGTVVEDLGYQEGKCSHAFRSVVFRGRVHQIDDLEEMEYAYRVMTDQLEPDPQAVRVRILKNEVDYKKALLYKIALTEKVGKGSPAVSICKGMNDE